MDFDLTMVSSRPGKINETLLCNVRHLENPLTLNVAFEVKVCISYSRFLSNILKIRFLIHSYIFVYFMSDDIMCFEGSGCGCGAVAHQLRSGSSGRNCRSDDDDQKHQSSSCKVDVHGVAWTRATGESKSPPPSSSPSSPSGLDSFNVPPEFLRIWQRWFMTYDKPLYYTCISC